MNKYRTEREVLCFRLSNFCNLNCLGCLSQSSPKNKHIPIDIERIEAIFERFKYIGVKKISYSGGEPLLVNELNQILEIGHRLGFSQILTTNGTISPRNKISINLLEYLKISLWGDAIFYKKNSNLSLYVQILKTIVDSLSDNFKIGLNIIVTSDLINRIEPFIFNLLKTYPELDNILLQSYLPMSDSDIWALTKQNKEYIADFVTHLNKNCKSNIKFLDLTTMDQYYIVVDEFGDIELQGKYSTNKSIIANLSEISNIDLSRLLNKMWSKKYNSSVFI